MAANNFQIGASILAADLRNLQSQITEAADAGISWFHVDIMDGHFVPPISFGASMVKLVKQCAPSCVCDVHLMVETPEKHIAQVLDAGADIVTFHPETTRRAFQCIADIHENGAKAGMAVSPGVSLTAAEAVVDQLDLLLIMTVEPGFGGQVMIEGMLSKITQARDLLDSNNALHARLEVDGGVCAENVARLRKAGADTFVAGSGLFKSGKIADNYAALYEGIAG